MAYCTRPSSRSQISDSGVGVWPYSPVLRHWITMLLLLLLLAGNICATELERFKRTIIGYYPVCPRGCASCSKVNGCVTCKPRLFLLLQRDGMRQTGACVGVCPAGFYGVRHAKYSRCRMCTIAHCEACFSQSYCTRCTPPYLASKGKCIEGCPNGMFYAQYSKECKTKVDCAVKAWSSWGTCVRHGQTCGYKYGLSMRTRDVIQLPSPNGVKCPVTTESRRCRMKYRSCVDLLNNRSDPLKDPITRSEHRSWRKQKRRRWVKKHSADTSRHRAELRDGEAQRRHRKRRRKERRRRLRAQHRGNQKPLLPDVTTNQIDVLSPPDVE